MINDLVKDRPLAFFDLETTGTSTANDRIVEVAVLVIEPGQAAQGDTKVRRLNPGVPIPAEASLVHGITDADVADCPTFRQIARSLWEALDPCDLCGFNIRRFDLPLLRSEFGRVGMDLRVEGRRIIDLQSLFHLEEPRDLAAATVRYAGCVLEDAHSAAADTEVLPAILAGQLAAHGHLDRDLDALHARCDELAPFQTEVNRWFGPDLDNPVFQFGKREGKSLEWVLRHDSGYIGWMMSKAEDMAGEVKRFVQSYRREVAA